jgi:hypothetical protein
MAALAIFAAGDTLGHIGGQEGCQQVAGKESASEGHGGCQGARMLMLVFCWQICFTRGLFFLEKQIECLVYKFMSSFRDDLGPQST